jgi:hypothetical protein
MGGFYGSVQLRTGDHAAVLAAATAVAEAMNIKCLVGPALNGWVGVYPEGNGQDHTVGERLAAAVGGHALHLLVHDDDVLAYWLWHDGKLVDRYWSAPGYFGDARRAEGQSLWANNERERAERWDLHRFIDGVAFSMATSGAARPRASVVAQAGCASRAAGAALTNAISDGMGSLSRAPPGFSCLASWSMNEG